MFNGLCWLAFTTILLLLILLKNALLNKKIIFLGVLEGNPYRFLFFRKLCLEGINPKKAKRNGLIVQYVSQRTSVCPNG